MRRSASGKEAAMSGDSSELLFEAWQYLQAHGYNVPPPPIVSDDTVAPSSMTDWLMNVVTMAANGGDPVASAAAQTGQAGREGLVDDALAKFPANEEQSAAQLAGMGGQDPTSQLSGLTQSATGIGQGIAGALSGLLQPLSQLAQQLPQLAEQALQTGVGALQGVGGAASTTGEVPGELLGEGLDGAGELAGAAGGAGAGLAGTMPASMLGPPPTPSAGTVPASSPTTPPLPAATPESAGAPRGGLAGMPIMPPGAMAGSATSGEAKPDTKRVVPPPVKNGAPVQGRISVPPNAPEVIKQLQGKPIATRRILGPDQTPGPAD
jgi:hypothetical protein